MDYAKIIGDAGEQIVRNIAEKYAYHQVILSDYEFTTSYGENCQIDHIIIRENGIFVIEVKNYRGKIYGKPDDREWTQVIGDKTYKFYNPVKQNWTHIRKIKDIIGPAPFIYNVIVFPRADISNVYDEHVMNLTEFEKTVFKSTEAVMEYYYVDYFYRELQLYLHKIEKDAPQMPYNEEDNLSPQKEKCSKCGRFIKQGRACVYCNNTVYSKSEKTQNEKKTRYCTKCGSLLNSEEICEFCLNTTKEQKNSNHLSFELVSCCVLIIAIIWGIAIAFLLALLK